MKTKHTKGEWIIEHDPDFSATYDFRGENIPTFEESPHNAKLIAAAPELLEALEEVEVFLGHIQPKIGEGAFDHIWGVVAEALQKATS